MEEARTNGTTSPLSLGDEEDEDSPAPEEGPLSLVVEEESPEEEAKLPEQPPKPDSAEEGSAESQTEKNKRKRGRRPKRKPPLDYLNPFQNKKPCMEGEDTSSNHSNGEVESNSAPKSGPEDEDNNSSNNPSQSSRQCSEDEAGTDSKKKKVYEAPKEQDIRVPLKYGWRRQTIIRCISKCGVRGEVVYYAPCGKKLKHYPEVTRYIEKHNLKNVKRHNFSFSPKIHVGEYLEPVPGKVGKFEKKTEETVLSQVERLRNIKGSLGGIHRRNLGSSTTPNSSPQHRQNPVPILPAKGSTSPPSSSVTKQYLQKTLTAKESLNSSKQQSKEFQRQQMMLAKALEAQREQEERERQRRKVMEEIQRKQALQREQQELDYIVYRELQNQVEDMMVKNALPLPQLAPLSCRRLSGEPFSKLLMVFEFIYNFGETLGFDVSQLPGLTTLQEGILNVEPKAEEDLLLVLQHLLVCVIDDPGVPSYPPISSILKQPLKKVVVATNNVTEVLRLYLDAQDESRPMCEWVKARPFLALRPNQKVEILHFICNELLTNDAVVNQVDTSIETVNTLRKDKWVLGSQLRRLFRIKHEKFQLSRGPNDTDPMYPFNEDEEVVVKREDLGDSEQEQPLSETEEDNNLSLDDLNKKIERAKRQQDRCKMKLDNASTRVRVLSYGQDRFRRRYWALPRIGGVLVEGAKSSRFTIEEETEQPMLDNPLHKFPDTPPTPPPDSSTSSSSKGTEPVAPATPPKPTPPPSSTEFPTSNGMYNSPFMASFLAGNMLFNPPMLPHHPSLMPLLHLPPYSSADKAATKPWFSILPRVACDSLPDDKESSPALVVSAEEPPATADAVVTSSSKPSSNHTPNLSASLSAATPHNSSSSSLFPPSPPKPVLTPSAKRRIVLDRLHQHEKPQPIPKEYEDGWWHVKSTAQLKQLVEALLVRGMRESLLFRNLRKHFTYSISICPQDSDKLKEETKEEEIKKEEDTEATGEEEPMEVVNKEEPEEEEEEEEKPEVKEAEPSLKTEPSEEEELPLEEEEEESEKKAEQVALRVDLSVLEQVEGLEEAVAGASMQVKDWQLPPRISSQANLEFHPSYLLPSVGPLPENWVNPVVLARERLLSLERAIEKRYLKPPLGFSYDMKLSQIPANTSSSSSTVQAAQPPYSSSRSRGSTQPQEDSQSPTRSEDAAPATEEDSSMVDVETAPAPGVPHHKEKVPPALVIWREAVKCCDTSAKVAMCLNQLDSSISWDKSVMKACCQFCCSDDKEEMLLLCDSCDKGYHTYCFKPELNDIPDGDWYCPLCLNKTREEKMCVLCCKPPLVGTKLISCDTCPKTFHLHCPDPPLARAPKGKWQCMSCAKPLPTNSKKKSSSTPCPPPPVKSTAATSSNSSPASTPSSQEPSLPLKRSQRNLGSTKKSQLEKDMAFCRKLLRDMEKHDDAWPFLEPVNTKEVPMYRKVVKKPMDLSTMKNKLNSHTYSNPEEFVADAILIFDNCEAFNEDDSEIGQAGHSMRAFFEKRWADLST